MKERVCLYACLLLLAGCGGKDEASNDDVKNVRIEVVTSASGGGAAYPGRVEAADEAGLAFRVGGTIERYYVEEGQTVKKGQLLAVLDATDYRTQLSATEAEYAKGKAQADRIIALYRDSVATPNDYDNAVYGMRQLEAKLQNHRDMLSYTRLTAPYDGTVQKRLHEEHETVAQGMPVISMVGGGEPEVEISLPAADYARRNDMTRWHCTISVFPGEEYELTPVSVSPKANANQLHTMRLRMSTAGKPQPAPGMSVMVYAEGDTTAVGARATTRVRPYSGRPNSEDGRPQGSPLQLSTSSVLGSDGRSYVFVYRGGVLRRCEVSIVGVNPDGTCIISSETVTVGDSVVVSGVRRLSDGDRVRLLEDSDTNVGGIL